MLPVSECQRKEDEEEVEELEAFHLYLLGEVVAMEDTANFLGLASGSALGCGFSTRSVVPEGAVHTVSAAALGLRPLRGARGLFAEAATHL